MLRTHDLLISNINTELTAKTLQFEESIIEVDNTLNPNYSILYNELLKDHQQLKSDNEKLRDEMLSLKKSDLVYQKINGSLRLNINILQKIIKNLKLILNQTQKTMSKQMKILSQNKTRSIENKAKAYLSTIFSSNQLDLIMKKKKRVRWTRDEIAKAFTLRYFSKRAYVFVNHDLQYPLPGNNIKNMYCIKQ